MSHRTPITVVDYGVNNIGSVLNMFRRLDVPTLAARTSAELENARAIVLPGIGAFDAGVTNLKKAGLFEAIRERVLRDGAPILGICLGMQLLSRSSEEGSLEGLDLLAATTRRFSFEGASTLKIPHMGWNETTCIDAELFANAGPSPRYYFVHSYHVVCDDDADVAARCTYGIPFTAAVRHGRVMGTQFHPEKSHRFGMRVLENFARLVDA